jgi:DNA-binding transcriptional ArsR family regulator
LENTTANPRSHVLRPLGPDAPQDPRAARGPSPATIGELAEPFGLTLNGVKKHVRVLEDADRVITEKVGRARECRLGPAQLRDAARWIEEYRRAWEGRLDRFGAYVEQGKAQRG